MCVGLLKCQTCMFCVTAGMGVSCNYLTAQAMAGVMFHDIRGSGTVRSQHLWGGQAPPSFRFCCAISQTFTHCAALFSSSPLSISRWSYAGMLIGLFAHRQRSGTVDQRVREGRVETKTAVEDCIVQYPSQRQRSDCLEELTLCLLVWKRAALKMPTTT